MKQVDRALGEAIRWRRGELDLKQEQLAKEVGVKTQTIGQWEKGRTVPKGANWEALLAALGMTAAELQLDAARRALAHLAEATPADPGAGHVGESTPRTSSGTGYTSDLDRLADDFLATFFPLLDRSRRRHLREPVVLQLHATIRLVQTAAERYDGGR